MRWLGFFLLLSAAFLLGKCDFSKWFQKKHTKHIVQRPPVLEHKPFVVIVPSYNNNEWVERNLRSIFEQKYDNFRVIYIDDASKDETAQHVRRIASLYKQEHRLELRCNAVNCGAVENIYRAAHSCAEREIIVICDGDDWLPHEHVLQRLNEIYADEEVWGTYGSYIEHPSYSYTVANFARPLPAKVVAKNKVREFSKEHWCLSHMRTFYAGLFKQIKLQDVLYEERYFDVAADVAFMIPLAEMAGKHLRFVEDVLYIYNRASPLNDNKLRAQRQRQATEHILSQRTYAPIASPFAIHSLPQVDLIAFSYDRPMQLYAFLESLERFGKNLQSVTILYRTSSPAFEEAYADVKEDFQNVTFVMQTQESEFKPLLMQALQQTKGDYLTCAVDDIILTGEIDFALGAKMLAQTGAYCFCYRLGQSVDYCYPLDIKQDVPPLVRVDADVFAWSFDDKKGDWNYQNSLDLALYDKRDVMSLWTQVSFSHPYSLETEWYFKEQKERLGLCHGHAKAVNIPMNIVHAFKNRHMHSYSTEELLEKFNRGLKIDIAPLYEIENHSAHIEYDVNFKDRKFRRAV